MSYNDIPIFFSNFIADDQTQGSANNASDLFIVDSTKFWVGVLTELNMVPLAQSTSQADEFDILEDVTFVMANEKYLARIQGITP